MFPTDPGLIFWRYIHKGTGEPVLEEIPVFEQALAPDENYQEESSGWKWDQVFAAGAVSANLAYAGYGLFKLFKSGNPIALEEAGSGIKRNWQLIFSVV